MRRLLVVLAAVAATFGTQASAAPRSRPNTSPSRRSVPDAFRELAEKDLGRDD